MDAKNAIRFAKSYVVDLFADEHISNVGLEEVEFKDGIWYVTVGFSRPWNSFKPASAFGSGAPIQKRDYRTVLLRDSDGAFQSVRMRETALD